MSAATSLIMETSSATEIDVQCGSGVTLPQGADPVAWAAAALAAGGQSAGARLTMTLRFVDAAEIGSLNESFRDKPGATNVLAFPAPQLPGLAELKTVSLGDVVICLPVAAAEASVQGKPLLAHCAHLVVHGTLHLLGFDHIDDSGAAEMEELETMVLEQLGVADPYAMERD